jgi:hypothetical protein
MGKGAKPPVAEIAEHARALLLSGVTDRDTALRGLLAIVERLRSSFNCQDDEVQPIAKLIAELQNDRQLPPS